MTGVILREYRADRRARLKVLALIALMLACGMLEVVINDLPGWVAAILPPGRSRRCARGRSPSTRPAATCNRAA
ncbi:hypothetical protein [Streptomyces sp. NBC_00443]|uniref:hypothetical protein n=1 Tax=Streptomyces sp. NBC_00443 TaxID=2975743 RepID=UPI002E1C0311